MSIFSDEALKGYADQFIETLPSDKKGALVGYLTTQGKWRVVGIYKGREKWQLGGQIEGDLQGGKISGSLQVLAVW